MDDAAFRQLVDQVRERTDLAALVGETVQLSPAGLESFLALRVITRGLCELVAAHLLVDRRKWLRKRDSNPRPGG